ncbi:MAG: helix-turn-helix domain-containing protein, partial [Muribaculum sp.]
REQKLSVAEVAYATGFSNPSHFTVAFKEMFGMPPTRYAGANKP